MGGKFYAADPRQCSAKNEGVLITEKWVHFKFVDQVLSVILSTRPRETHEMQHCDGIHLQQNGRAGRTTVQQNPVKIKT